MLEKTVSENWPPRSVTAGYCVCGSTKDSKRRWKGKDKGTGSLFYELPQPQAC
jgi:hypothetical protein